MLRRLFTSSLLVAVSGGLLACGGAETSNAGATTPGSLNGSVANPISVPLGKSIHAAIVWHTVSGFSVGQNVAVQGADASFALDLLKTPPASAFIAATRFAGASASWPASTKIAVGTVVSYDDSNGNATLDLSQSGAASADEIVASNSTQMLVYVDGPAAGDGGIARIQPHRVWLRLRGADVAYCGRVGAVGRSRHRPSKRRCGLNALDGAVGRSCHRHAAVGRSCHRLPSKRGRGLNAFDAAVERSCHRHAAVERSCHRRAAALWRWCHRRATVSLPRLVLGPPGGRRRYRSHRGCPVPGLPARVV